MGVFRKKILAALFIVLSVFFCACESTEEEVVKKVEFTVCDTTRIPTELVEIIEEKKEKIFKMTYINSGYMYIVVGYGEHSRKNLNVVVENLYMTDNAIYVETNLFTDEMTPTDATAKGAASIYPYIVLKCEKYDLPVVFDID